MTEASTGVPVSFGFIFDTPLIFWGEKPERPRVSSTLATLPELHETVYSASLSRNLTARFSRIGIVSLSASVGFDEHRLARDNIERTSLDKSMLERAEQVRLLNAFALCLHSVITDGPYGFIDPTTVTSDSAGIVTFDSAGNLDTVSGRLRLLVRDRQQVWVANISGYPEAAMSKACELFEAVLVYSDLDLVPLLALLNEAATSYRLHNYAATTIFAWSVCERIQNVIWQKHFTAALSPDGPSKKQREAFLGRDYSAAVVTSILQLAGIYNNEFAQVLGTVRKRRNTWLHDGGVPSREDASSCLDCAIKLLDGTFKIPVTVSRNFGLHY